MVGKSMEDVWWWTMNVEEPSRNGSPGGLEVVKVATNAETAMSNVK